MPADSHNLATRFREDEPARVMGDDDVFRMNVLVMVEAEEHGVVHDGGAAVLPFLRVMDLGILDAASAPRVSAGPVACKNRLFLRYGESALCSRCVKGFSVRGKYHSGDARITENARKLAGC